MIGPEGDLSLVKRLIEECNVSYALSVAEEIEGAEPSNYSEANFC
jgi:hypothetical protein